MARKESTNKYNIYFFNIFFNSEIIYESIFSQPVFLPGLRGSCLIFTHPAYWTVQYISRNIHLFVFVSVYHSALYYSKRFNSCPSERLMNYLQGRAVALLLIVCSGYTYGCSEGCLTLVCSVYPVMILPRGQGQTGCSSMIHSQK